MTANSRLGPRLRPPRRHGHVPGVGIGDTFADKGELAICGVHNNITSGIDAKCAAAASVLRPFFFCMSRKSRPWLGIPLCPSTLLQ